MNNGVQCKKCMVDRIPTQKIKLVTLSGVIGTALFIIGVTMASIDFYIGGVLIVIALLINLSKSKKTVMVCPSCDRKGRTL